MDLDVFGGGVDTLKKNGYKIIEDISFQRNLSVFGITALQVGDKDKAKHTDTVQRFKVNLKTVSGVVLPTKIEFSQIQQVKKYVVQEKVDPTVSNVYNKIGFLCPHYSAEAAFLQKILAVAGRSETQARDLFDLDLIHSEFSINQVLIKADLTTELLNLAITKADLITYDDFKGQVLEYI